jgi:micrococcal nuclease
MNRKLRSLLISAIVLLIYSGLNLVTSTPKVSPTPIPSSPAVLGDETKAFFKVTKVVDGDTIYIDYFGNKETVRYIGIDTPETVDPRRPVGCFGKEASQENKKLVEGREVSLVKDISDRDKFGRLLRYVYLKVDEGTLFVNDYLVREGFARASTYPPDIAQTERLKAAEEAARLGKKGLWADDTCGGNK